ncbi:hypothetical protein [Desulfosporosinus youngiae]|uniref:DoxX protein n=1 Tax=Desulfosporosinus youngiae DSM 17734 TaxID=768710 RepID=H5Y3U5_9FIRM|nr:hypothetical protein [Desulfosporosinus youngiae]EHQ89483.1 hypothetical protein DesyoDRAFT_2407 [Desulfosporosinus youngiae DSM 17734]
MTSYFEAVKTLFRDRKVAFLVIIFTAARVIYGWSWVESASHKLGWFSDGKLNSAGRIESLITNIAGPNVSNFDPLYINKGFSWVAQTIFLGTPGLTDTLVVIIELLVGLSMLLGFRIVWFALLAMFMNVQFLASGSFNNFGYIWTNLAFLKFAQYAELLGVGGFLKYKQNPSHCLVPSSIPDGRN